MIDIKILRAMVAAGAPVEAILAAVEADQAAESVRVQARRDADAERQRRKRGVRVTDRDTNGQTVTPRDTADNERSYLLTSSSLQTSENKQEKEGSKKVRAVRVGKTLLPDSWTPNAKHYAKGDAHLVDRKAEDMRNWAKSKAIMRADWDATFHGFLKPDEMRRGHVNGKSGTGVMAAIDDLIDRAGSPAVGGDAEMVDVTPGRAQGH